MMNADIRTVDKSTLSDMSGFKFDKSLPQLERAKRFFTAIKNPYLFRLDDMAIKVEFTDDGPPLQDLMAALLLRQKRGV
jgi:hypothetical protein